MVFRGRLPIYGAFIISLFFCYRFLFVLCRDMINNIFVIKKKDLKQGKRLHIQFLTLLVVEGWFD
jgi:hypothetical protein